MYKLLRSEVIEPRYMVGVDPPRRACASRARPGWRRRPRRRLAARPSGAARTSCSRPRRPTCTSATRPATEAAGIRAVDLTPAARGPYVIPPVNLREHLDEPNLNMVTCGGQATIPIVHAVSRVVARRLRRDRGHGRLGLGRPGHPAATSTSSPAPRLAAVRGDRRRECGARRSSSSTRPSPPLIMRDTIYCSLPGGRRRGEGGPVDPGHGGRGADLRARLPAAGRAAVRRLEDGTGRVATFLEVEGAGDYLPPYSGNLDIMTAAATKVGEEIAARSSSPRESEDGS